MISESNSHIDENGVRWVHLTGTDLMRGEYPDGSMAVKKREEITSDEPQNGLDKTNLMNEAPRNEVMQMAFQLHKLIEADRESYSIFYAQLGKFINLLGFSLNDEGDLKPLIDQGSDLQIKSTALSRTLVNFIASIAAYLFPVSGITDTQINGAPSEESENRADNVQNFANRFFEETHAEFKEETLRAIIWAIIAGYGVKKDYIDPITLEPTSRFVRNQDFIIHYDNTSSVTAHRKTHIIRLTKREYKLRCLQGYYVDNAQTMGTGSNTDSTEALDSYIRLLQGVNPDGNDEEENKIYELWETECDYNLPYFKNKFNVNFPLTYVLTLDAKTKLPVRLARNWRADNPLKALPSPYTIYSFLPSVAGLGMGLLHLCGASADAASSILQTLIKAGEFATTPAGFISNSAQIGTTELSQPIPGVLQSVFTSGNIDESIHYTKSKEPSPTLKEVMSQLEDSITSLSSLTVDQMAKLADQAAITMLTLIAEVQKTPNVILQRFYSSLKEELARFQYLLYEWVGSDNYTFMGSKGLIQINQQDLSLESTINPQTGEPTPIIRLIPAAQPNIKNTAYRMLESEVLLNHAVQQPQLFNMREIMRYVLLNMGLDNTMIDSFLVPEPNKAPPPPPTDPITENQKILTGQPVKAYPFQDQNAYIAVNSLLLQYPDPQIVANAQALIHQRHALTLLNQFQQAVGQPMPDDPSQLPPEAQNQIAMMAAQAVQQGTLTTPGVQPQPTQPDPVAMQREKIQSDQQIAQMKSQTEHERIQADLEMARMKMLQDERKAEHKSISDALSAEIEQQKLSQKVQIDQMKMELEKERVEREHIASIVTMLREELQLLQQKESNYEI